MEVSPLSGLRVVALRFQPEEDLRHGLLDLCKRHRWSAAVVLSGIGSLSQAHLRMAGEAETVVVDRPVEILSLGGTLSQDGCHLHIQVSDAAGSVVGGHLRSPSPIRTTAEVVLGVLEDAAFFRKHDPRTGFDELTFLRPDGPD